MTFNRALDFILAFEGGYSNDPRDPGGETNFGISKRAHPGVDIKNLTIEEAEKIYFTDYYQACRCGELPNGLSVIVFDAAVNQGKHAAKTMLQDALNAQGGIPLKPDGVIGPLTMAAVRRADAKAATIEMAAQRMELYGRNNNFHTFGLGWSRRLMACLALALETR